MNLTDVMEELADKLRGFTGISVHSYPVDSIVSPAAVFGYPERIEYDVTYQDGDNTFWNLPLYMVTERVDSQSARVQASKWTDPRGGQSIKKFLDKENYRSCDSVQVVQATFDVMTIAGIDYLAVVFELNVSGEGE